MSPDSRVPARRRYRRVGDLGRDLAWLTGEWRTLLALHGHPVVTPELRERLMLAVTSVNDCRYCARFHAHLALAAGMEPEEVASLLGGDVSLAPEEQRVALLYALEWAESDARPGPGARRVVAARYGEETTRAIEAALRTIRLANLLGNTWDDLFRRLTRGRLGC